MITSAVVITSMIASGKTFIEDWSPNPLSSNWYNVGGGMTAIYGNWTIGRGQWNGGNADWANAIIDEVRINNKELLPLQLLAVPIPEPGIIWIMGLVGIMGVLGVRNCWAASIVSI